MLERIINELDFSVINDKRPTFNINKLKYDTPSNIVHHEVFNKLKLLTDSNRLFELSERYVGTGLSHSIPLVVRLVKEYKEGFESRYIEYPTPLFIKYKNKYIKCLKLNSSNFMKIFCSNFPHFSVTFSSSSTFAVQFLCLGLRLAPSCINQPRLKSPLLSSWSFIKNLLNRHVPDCPILFFLFSENPADCFIGCFIFILDC
ncbi:hypothetical protein BpHYR1_041821 [Brachionus plicatilis]|uniref:Uncharacterized protein n=1 Tax=Brachionus plicatilis TaxID=10195 RepID=A0A3M7R6G3_BRAPC|nr:hypothetical protein BpHYR1_041821 [Brachionus plicatilis]